MNYTKILWTLAIIITLLGFGMIAVHWSQLPEQVPMHFNLQGKADRWGDRSEIFILPIINIFLCGLMYWISKNAMTINPHKLGAKNERQLQLSRIMIAEMTVLCTILFTAGVYEIMVLSVTGDTRLSGLILPLLGVGFLVIYGLYFYRLKWK
ncbi:DUF1648 domain-containing protein [Dokdonia sinensis]|uniref:DUF1648 domain-containing protein n=1 Tax=Dokdonia sinensis TaxID=2479847 RepID=A0A3M0FVX6_9FLAO|nr:DUF1648 domain-containing protein [Dokdonia sinensis]RMB56628.1 DUF1648 domain-containing protein [Dokdonia sinensis]